MKLSRHIRWVLVFAWMLLIAPAHRAADTLPATISDQEFGRMITTFSEPGGTFRYENFLSNERSIQYVIPELKANTKPGGVYLGVAAEESFRYVKEMQRKNLIVPLVGDFAGPSVIRNIARYLKERDAIVTAFYVSNVERYLAGPQWQSFYSNVAALPLDASSVFIRFVDNDYTRLLQGWTPEKDVQTGLVPMLELIELSNAGKLPSYTQVLSRQKALP